tara:strand:+ start:9322 stop:10803 length:1482 start_codon:yes stop_codon:yes gene_type:complete
MADEKGTLEVKNPSPDKIGELNKVLQGFTDTMKEMKDASKTISEQKEQIDKMKADMAVVLETAETERKAAAERKAIKGAIKEDVGFGYDAKAVLRRNEHKSLSFDDLLLVKNDNTELQSMQSRSSDIFIVAHILSTKHNVSVKDVIPQLKIYKDFMKDTEEVRKAMSIGAGAEGNDWIPTGFSADLIEIFHLQLVVGNMHPQFTIPAKMTSWKVPGVSSDLKAYRTEAANSDTPTKFTASTRTTRNITFTPEKLAAATVFDVELEEDSIIQILPMLKVNIAMALVRAVEDTIINGDTGGTMDNTDMHGRTIDNESPTKMWDGYRTFITDHGSVRLNAGGAATFGGMITVMRNMGKYAVGIANKSWVTSVNGYFDAFLHLSKVQTIDLMGPQAIIQRGELAKFMGIPIVVSEQARQDLKTTTGVSGGASSGYTDTSVQCVYKPAWNLGTKRRISVESAKIPRTDSVEVWSTMRVDFQPSYGTSEGIVSEATNVA